MTVSCGGTSICHVGGYLGAPPLAAASRAAQVWSSPYEQTPEPTGDTPLLLVSSGRDLTWRLETEPPHLGVVTSLSCVGSSECLGLGYSKDIGISIDGRGQGAIPYVLPFITGDGGRTWRTWFGAENSATDQWSNDVLSASCGPGPSCVVLSDNGGNLPVVTRYQFKKGLTPSF